MKKFLMILCFLSAVAVPSVLDIPPSNAMWDGTAFSSKADYIACQAIWRKHGAVAIHTSRTHAYRLNGEKINLKRKEDR